MSSDSDSNRKPSRDMFALFGFVALCLVISGLGGAITATSVGNWYQTLAKPSFNPPDWVFAPVWSTLYILIAVAGWRIWRHRQRKATRNAFFYLCCAVGPQPILVWIVLWHAAYRSRNGRDRNSAGFDCCEHRSVLAHRPYRRLANDSLYFLGRVRDYSERIPLGE